MSKQRKNEGELSEQQLDKVAGGQQEVVKMGTIVVEAKRPKPAQAQPQQVVKMETIVVTAQREKPDVAGAKLAQREVAQKKD